MNRSVLAAQPIPNVVRTITANEAGKAGVGQPALSEITRKFAHANFGKAFWQLLDTLVPYGTLWVLMLYAV
jgi:hypothetical protein